MELKTLIRVLRESSQDRFDCPGCYKNNTCDGRRDCRLMKEAASRLEIIQTGLYRIEKMHESAKGAEKALLGEVLELLGGVDT